MEVQILTPQPWTLVRDDVTSDEQVRTTRKIAQQSTTKSSRKLTRENITHIWGLSSMVEHGSVKPAMEVQFFQSPPYYYEHIETKDTHNNVANQKS